MRQLGHRATHACAVDGPGLSGTPSRAEPGHRLLLARWGRRGRLPRGARWRRGLLLVVAPRRVVLPGERGERGWDRLGLLDLQRHRVAVLEVLAGLQATVRRLGGDERVGRG